MSHLRVFMSSHSCHMSHSHSVCPCPTDILCVHVSLVCFCRTWVSTTDHITRYRTDILLLTLMRDIHTYVRRPSWVSTTDHMTRRYRTDMLCAYVSHMCVCLAVGSTRECLCDIFLCGLLLTLMCDVSYMCVCLALGSHICVYVYVSHVLSHMRVSHMCVCLAFGSTTDHTTRYRIDILLLTLLRDIHTYVRRKHTAYLCNV